MSGLENLNIRMKYYGGKSQQGRMNEDKLRTLKKALIYSYQAATAVLSDGREFRCLINPNKLDPDYDKKILSIPFEDICLNSDRVGTTTEGKEKIGLKCGDVFKWKENDSYWLVYLKYLQETAYLRAEIYMCESELEINNVKYKIYLKGPTETDIAWNQKSQVEWNDLNYRIMIYITKDENTLDFFKRFQRVKIDGKQYKVADVDSYNAEGVIQVYLQEDFTNTLEDEGYIEPTPIETPTSGPRILGKSIVSPYDTMTYMIADIAEGGKWTIDNPKKAKIISSDNNSVKIEVITGKSGEFTLSYISEENELKLPITIVSL